MDARMLNMPTDMRSCTTAGLLDKVALFNKKSDEHLKSQAVNPFSGECAPRPKLNKNDKDYGRPVAGSKTAMRGQKAANHISKEVLELCNIIHECGYEIDEDDPRKVISFGELFNIYTCISNKVVGLLLRARKQKIVEFEGETLFQRRDDDVAIFLTKPISEIREHFKQLEAERREEENGH